MGALQVREHVIELPVFTMDQVQGLVENRRVHTQTPGDIQRGGPAGDAGDKPVGWSQRVDVEFEARVQKSGRRKGQRLQRIVVRRHDDLEVEFGKPAEQRLGQGRAFGGIG